MSGEMEYSQRRRGQDFLEIRMVESGLLLLLCLLSIFYSSCAAINIGSTQSN